jgi:hypothetical protein
VTLAGGGGSIWPRSRLRPRPDVSAETACASFHKPLRRERALETHNTVQFFALPGKPIEPRR